MGRPTQEDFLNIIKGKISGLEQFAEQIGKSRFAVYRTETYAGNEKEEAEFDAIMNAFKCKIQQNGNSFSLFFYMDEHNPGGYLEIIDAGMEAPLAGGKGGISTNPDGSTYDTPTPRYRWDEPVPEYAKPGSGVIGEVYTIVRDLFQTEFRQAVADSKQEIMALVKDYVAERIHAAAAGG